MTPLEYLTHLELHGIKLGLDTISRLLQRAGSPQNAYPTVHIAGSNGKGSVVAFLDAIFQSAGYRTGRFTSPHLCDMRERFQVNGQLIGSEEQDELIEYYRELAGALEDPPTFFEVNTAMAFRYFAHQEVDAAIIEVGMGGRLDCTNVLAPAATAITNIALEHTQFLGNTLEEIAVEKAGIIKSATPLVLAEEAAAPQSAILARANELGCPVRLLGRDFSFTISGDPFDQRFSYREDGLILDGIPLSLRGAYQGKNAAVAVSLAQELRRRFPKIETRHIRAGLERAVWPCRLEKVVQSPPVIVDVAHNAAGCRELAKALRPGANVFVLAVASDKNAAAMIDALAPSAHTFIFSQFTGGRALPADALSQAAAGRPHVIIPKLSDAIAHGIEGATEHVPLVIAGSVFTAGEARTILVDQHGAPPMVFAVAPAP